jgi:hypothetical protein
LSIGIDTIVSGSGLGDSGCLLIMIMTVWPPAFYFVFHFSAMEGEPTSRFFSKKVLFFKQLHFSSMQA